MPADKWKTAIDDFLTNKITREDLGRLIEEDDQDPSTLPSIAISTLSTVKVEDMLSLKFGFNDHELTDVKPLAMPVPLVRDLSIVDDATSQRPSCEARLKLNVLLFYAHHIAMKD
ncbi:hypothetical protein PITC_060180 [Penicillium italicum]|uniref:Uncharacterized protein n=1 Tax=Penicillium italicum TaxID=40296 RepID=A0A0A2LCK4_PENIT|nr:hypothetical protein PITC_060180 [Penicillium italicum]